MVCRLGKFPSLNLHAGTGHRGRIKRRKCWTSCSFEGESIAGRGCKWRVPTACWLYNRYLRGVDFPEIKAGAYIGAVEQGILKANAEGLALRGRATLV